MTISRLKILGMAVLASAFAPDGGPALGQTARPVPGREPARDVRDTGGVPQAAPTRSADPSAQAIDRLADALKRHPARRRGAGKRLQLYMMDLAEGGTTLLADEPDLGLDYCNTPSWSHDGTRNRLPGPVVGRAGRVAPQGDRGPRGMPDPDGPLGPGHCPTFSRDDRRIAFVLNPGEEPGVEGGVWVMQADGSDRRRVGEFGFPHWSPDGRRFLLNQDTPTSPPRVGRAQPPGQGGGPPRTRRAFDLLVAQRLAPGTLVSAIGTGREGEAIAVLDVREAAEAKIIEVLWKRGDALDVEPLWPVYSPVVRRCVFIGAEPTRRALYAVRRGESVAKRAGWAGGG